MNTPERKSEHRDSQVNWATKKAPRHIPQHVLDAVCRKLSFTSFEKVTSIR